MATTAGDMIGIARQKQFFSIVMKEGKIKRGVLVSKMSCSMETFAREYKSYLETYPNIFYDRKTREFEYRP